MIACCQSGSDAKLTARALHCRGLSGCAAHVLILSEKRSDDHNVRVRLRTRRSRAELMLKSETVNPEHVRGEMAKLNPSEPLKLPWIARTGITSALPQRGARRENNDRCAQESKKICEGAVMTGNRRKCISKFPMRRYGKTPGSSECLGDFCRDARQRAEKVSSG